MKKRTQTPSSGGLKRLPESWRNLRNKRKDNFIPQNDPRLKDFDKKMRKLAYAYGWGDIDIYKLGLTRFQIYAKLLGYLENAYGGVLISLVAYDSIDGIIHMKSNLGTGVWGKGYQIIIKEAIVREDYIELSGFALNSGRQVTVRSSKEYITLELILRLQEKKVLKK